MQSHTPIKNSSTHRVRIKPKRTNITNLPPELISYIASYLSFTTLLSLRSTCKSLSLATFPSFRPYLHTKSIDLTPTNLRTIITHLSTNGPSCYTTHLIFTGSNTSSSTSSSSSTSTSSTHHPTQILKSLEQIFTLAQTHGSLHSLDIHCQAHGSLVTILLALQSTGLPLRKLAIYPKGGVCVTNIDAYRITNIDALEPCFRDLTDLTWALAADSFLASATAGLGGEGLRDIETVVQVLGMVSNLERLDLLWYNRPHAERLETHIFEKCVDGILAMERLTVLTLRGIYVNESVLVSFLERTRVESVTLVVIRLSAGVWRAVFDVLTSGRFKAFQLEHLYERRDSRYQMVKFKEAEVSRVPRDAGFGKSAAISRLGVDEVRAVLEYRLEELTRHMRFGKNREMLMYGSEH